MAVETAQEATGEQLAISHLVGLAKATSTCTAAMAAVAVQVKHELESGDGRMLPAAKRLRTAHVAAAGPPLQGPTTQHTQKPGRGFNSLLAPAGGTERQDLGQVWQRLLAAQLDLVQRFNSSQRHKAHSDIRRILLILEERGLDKTGVVEKCQSRETCDNAVWEDTIPASSVATAQPAVMPKGPSEQWPSNQVWQGPAMVKREPGDDSAEENHHDAEQNDTQLWLASAASANAAGPAVASDGELPRSLTSHACCRKLTIASHDSETDSAGEEEETNPAPEHNRTAGLYTATAATNAVGPAVTRGGQTRRNTRSQHARDMFAVADRVLVHSPRRPGGPHPATICKPETKLGWKVDYDDGYNHLRRVPSGNLTKLTAEVEVLARRVSLQHSR